VEDIVNFVDAKAGFVDDIVNFVDAKASFVYAIANFVDAKASFVYAIANFVDAIANFVDAKAGFVEDIANFVDAKAGFVEDVRLLFVVGCSKQRPLPDPLRRRGRVEQHRDCCSLLVVRNRGLSLTLSEGEGELNSIEIVVGCWLFGVDVRRG
jgi:hypothetical protein